MGKLGGFHCLVTIEECLDMQQHFSWTLDDSSQLHNVPKPLKSVYLGSKTV